MRPSADNTLTNEWDIRLETLPPYTNDLRQLREFQKTGKGDRRRIVRCIRPVLVGNVRLRFHIEIGDKDYSKKYHHQQNPLGVTGADPEPIDETKLSALVRRTLTLVTS